MDGAHCSAKLINRCYKHLEVLAANQPGVAGQGHPASHRKAPCTPDCVPSGLQQPPVSMPALRCLPPKNAACNSRSVVLIIQVSSIQDICCTCFVLRDNLIRLPPHCYRVCSGNCVHMRQRMLWTRQLVALAAAQAMSCARPQAKPHWQKFGKGLHPCHAGLQKLFPDFC